MPDRMATWELAISPKISAQLNSPLPLLPLPSLSHSAPVFHQCHLPFCNSAFCDYAAIKPSLVSAAMPLLLDQKR